MRRVLTPSLSLLLMGTAVALAAVVTVPLVLDSSGTNDGVGYGGLTGGVGATANTASSYGFDGAVGTFVQIEPDASLRQSQLTVSAWVNPDCLTAPCGVVSNEGAAFQGNMGYGLRLFPNGTAQWCVAQVSGLGACAYSAAGQVPQGSDVWTHLVGTYNHGTKKLTVYVNGNISSGGFPGTLNPATNPDGPIDTELPLYIGRLPGAGGGSPLPYTGLIDDVRIYETVLPYGDIIDGEHMPEDNLVGWWKLDELPGLTKDDCKRGGWQGYGFKNQGQCIRFVNTGKDSR